MPPAAWAARSRSPAAALRPSPAPVPVFEPDHVFELGGAGLEDVAIRERDHAVHHPRADANGLARPQRHIAPALAAVVLEAHRPGEQVDRLILLPVVLQAQRVTGVDVKNFSYVPLGVRPDQLVAPRPLDALRSVPHIARHQSADFAHASEGSHGAVRRQAGERPEVDGQAGASRSSPPMYGRIAWGRMTLPSACCPFSRMATTVRPTASPLPFSVATRRGFSPCAGRKRICARRAWNSPNVEQELISR